MHLRSHIARRFMPRLVGFEPRLTPTTTPHNLTASNFYQNWNNASLITVDDDWSSVPGVIGYFGDDTFGEGVDPQTVLTLYATVDVIANMGSNTALTTGGIAEFDGFSFNSVVALQGDATADAPNLVVFLNTTGRANISISYSLRDMDSNADNAIQPFALQYRIGNAGNFVNVPAGFVADATDGPFSTKVSPVNVTLPSAVDNQSLVQVRIITTNAVGNDEWVGVKDIVVGSKDFAINTFTTGNQSTLGRSVAVDADGDAVVVWESFGQDDGSFYHGIYGQRFNSAGAKVGGEFQVNTYTTNQQRYPSVAVDADGDAMVVWQSYDQDKSGYGIYGQRFNSAGAKVGGELRINTHTTGTQTFPSVSMDADGDTVVVWESFNQNGNPLSVYGQRFNSSGAVVGGEFQINTYTTAAQRFPSVAVDADGDAVVVWQSSGQDGNLYGIYGQRFNSAGAKVGVEFPINSFTTNQQRFPSVAVDADGDAVVVWQSFFQVGSDENVFGQRFDTSGAKVGGEFLINTFTSSFQGRPSVAVDADGDTMVVWHSSQDGSGYGIYGQRFNSAGARFGGEFQINTYTTNQQRLSSVAMDTDGDAVVVWQSYYQDGGLEGVYGQRFQPPPVPPAKLASIQVNNGSPQRSMVTSLKIAFDAKVSFTGSPAAAFALVNQKTSNATTLAAVVNLAGTEVTLTFIGGSVDLGGSLADGRYTLSIVAGQFTGSGFDGDGNGTAGDDYVLIGTPANGLFRLFGDENADGGVSASDFIQFRLALGGSSVSFDFDNDGSVAASDFIQFRLRFGGSV